MVRKCKCLLTVCLVLCGGILQAAHVVKGDSEDEQKSFNTPLSVFAADRKGEMLYVGAKDEGAEKYALAFLPRGAEKFFELAPEKVKINGILADNPLHNAPIKLMTLLGENYRPVVVPNGTTEFLKPSNLYYVDNFDGCEHIDMLATLNIVEADVKVTSGMTALAATNFDRGGFIFATVKNNAGDDFGANGSGIATLVAHFEEQGEGDKKTSHFVLNQIGVHSFNRTISQIKIGNDVTFLNNGVVDLYWDNYLRRLYIAVQLQAYNGAGDGVKSLVVGRIDDKNRLILESIAPDAVFEGEDKIVGATGTDVHVSLHKVRTMLTSTSLSYVIVLGGNGDPDSTKRSVFALPIVSNDCEPNILGTLAKKDDKPVDTYSDEYPHRFKIRGFKTAAITAADAVSSNDIQTQVGGGNLNIGDIEHIFVRDDSVFAVVPVADDGKLSGVFYSRALFDELGCIKAWTEWRRVSGVPEDNIFGAALDTETADFILVTGTASDSIDIVKRTGWGHGDKNGLGPLSDLFSTVFPGSAGGIHGIVDRPLNSPGLDNISLLMATGGKSVSLVQAGTEDGPTHGQTFINDSINFGNGVIDQVMPSSTRSLNISGGDLNKLELINSAEIAVKDTKAYLLVGGKCGLAVLLNESGMSWDTNSGLGSGFAGIDQGSAFKVIGSYQRIRKLIADGGFLYVLTDSKLDRIDLVESDFAHNNLVTKTIAAIGSTPALSNYSTLFDVVVSDKLALLATSVGLFRTANDCNVQTMQSADGWTSITRSEECFPVTQLFAISSSGLINDVARREGGDLYALSSYTGKNRAQLNRYSIQSVEGATITNDTVQPFPDIFIKDKTSYFVNFGQYRDWILSDGSLFFHEINRNMSENPVIHLLWSRARSGSRFAADKNKSLPIDLKDTSFLLPMLRNSATGAWLLAGNDGLRINE